MGVLMEAGLFEGYLEVLRSSITPQQIAEVEPTELRPPGSELLGVLDGDGQIIWAALRLAPNDNLMFYVRRQATWNWYLWKQFEVGDYIYAEVFRGWEVVKKPPIPGEEEFFSA